MKTFPYKQILRRYRVLAFIFTLLGVMIIGKAAYIMFVKRTFWTEVSDRFVREGIEVAPKRGNIFSADGQLLATSLPEYKIFMDYKVYDRDSLTRIEAQKKRDSLFLSKIDSLSEGLNRILPDKPTSWYRQRLREGFDKRSRHWLLYPSRISYMDYKEVLKLPFFNLGKIASGFHEETYNETKKPFGSLASRTLGDMYPGKDSARSGLELAYDTILRGKPGIIHRQKVRNRYLDIEDSAPEDGADIVTTLDVKMQDFAEKALVDKLKEIGGIHGVVLLMEVATGDVKAIVNMSRCADGQYREIKNTAVSNLMEPGSVFKPMSFMVAFDDNKLSMNDRVNVAPGIRVMYNRKMKDHNWHRGGYGVLTVPECLEYSSNIGVSVLIDKIYHNHPEKFVDGLYRIGIAEDLHLDIPGYARPRIRRPLPDHSNWSNTALPWMSIGYETQVPPISVLNFYNGVANGGRMMRPRFVTCAMRNGEVIQEYPPQVIREHMCSPQALKNIQTCLRWVVSKGLGKKAGSRNFSVSGKTGTAQVWGTGGFSLDYLVSFAGYFPSEAPKYSCMVAIIKHGLPASGGGQCGPVFKQVAEMVMASSIKPSLVDASDTLHNHLPLVSYGNLLYANKVLEDMNLSTVADWTSANPNETVWGRAVTTAREVMLKAQTIDPTRVPDVRGLGARDAVYLLERLGLRVTISGFGYVQQQNLPPTHIILKGEHIHLILGMKGFDPNDFLLDDKPAPPLPITGEPDANASSSSSDNGATQAATNQGTTSASTSRDVKAQGESTKMQSESAKAQGENNKAAKKHKQTATEPSSTSTATKSSAKTSKSDSKANKNKEKAEKSNAKADKKAESKTPKGSKAAKKAGRASSKSSSTSAKSAEAKHAARIGTTSKRHKV